MGPLIQSSKKTKHVPDPNFGKKMSDLYVFVNYSQIRITFVIKFVLKLEFIHLWSIDIKLCFMFSNKISHITINGLYFLSWTKMSGFIQNNIRDPRSQDPNFLEL